MVQAAEMGLQNETVSYRLEEVAGEVEPTGSETVNGKMAKFSLLVIRAYSPGGSADLGRRSQTRSSG
jgi:hypothetical protein